MKKFFVPIFTIGCILLIVSCREKSVEAAGVPPVATSTQEGSDSRTTKESAAQSKSEAVAQKPQVAKQITSPASKGIIQSVTDVPVYSLISSVVTEVNVKQGQQVKAGQVLISLNSTEIQNQINLSNSQIQQANFQYESIIVGQGYDMDNTAAIPEKIRNAARIRSSLPVYEEQMKIYQQQLDYTRIKAPVSGVVTDVTIHKHDLAQQGLALCRIIDPENLRVAFTILESEVSMFKVGSVVNVSTVAYPQEQHKATVNSIKPKVEETGMIILTATLEDHEHLMPGMTAIVTLVQ